MEPTLTQVFGANATQTSTTLTISKADLVGTGLTVSANNTAESLLVAIIKLADDYLNSANQESNQDIQITIEDSGYPQIVIRGANNTQYRQTTYNLNFQKIEAAYTLDPDDF